VLFADFVAELKRGCLFAFDATWRWALALHRTPFSRAHQAASSRATLA